MAIVILTLIAVGAVGASIYYRGKCKDSESGSASGGTGSKGSGKGSNPTLE